MYLQVKHISYTQQGWSHTSRRSGRLQLQHCPRSAPMCPHDLNFGCKIPTSAKVTSKKLHFYFRRKQPCLKTLIPNSNATPQPRDTTQDLSPGMHKLKWDHREVESLGACQNLAQAESLISVQEGNKGHNHKKVAVQGEEEVGTTRISSKSSSKLCWVNVLHLALIQK